MTTTKHKYKKVIFTIDSDFTELVEAVDLEFTKRGSDLKIKTFLAKNAISRLIFTKNIIFLENRFRSN